MVTSINPWLAATPHSDAPRNSASPKPQPTKAIKSRYGMDPDPQYSAVLSNAVKTTAAPAPPNTWIAVLWTNPRKISSSSIPPKTRRMASIPA